MEIDYYNSLRNRNFDEINEIENSNSFKENFSKYLKLNEKQKKEFQPTLNEYFNKRSQLIKNDYLALNKNEKNIENSYLDQTQMLLTDNSINSSQVLKDHYNIIKSETIDKMGELENKKIANLSLQALEKRNQLRFVPETEKEEFKEKNFNEFMNQLSDDEKKHFHFTKETFWNKSTGRYFNPNNVNFERDYNRSKKELESEHLCGIGNGYDKFKKFSETNFQANKQDKNITEKIKDLEKEEKNQKAVSVTPKLSETKKKKDWVQQAIPMVLIALAVMTLIMLITKLFNKNKKEKLEATQNTFEKIDNKIKETENENIDNKKEKPKFLINKNANENKSLNLVGSKDEKKVDLTTKNIDNHKDLSNDNHKDLSKINVISKKINKIVTAQNSRS